MNKMAIVTPYLSLMTLHGNGWNSPIERKSGWMDFKMTQIYAVYRDSH